MTPRQDPQMDFHVSLIDHALTKAIRSLERAQAKVADLNEQVDKLERQRQSRLGTIQEKPDLFVANQ